MSTLIVPALEEEPYPTLGGDVADWIEDSLVFGPGDLRGEPARLDPEKRGLLYRMYEVYPKGHPEAGRRRFRRVAISLRKGSAKTEFAAWIAAAEAHPEAPVRCVGWRGDSPIGGPVTDPYIPLVAFTQEQSEELAYGALYAILLESPIADDFDLGLTRIIRRDGTGRVVALSNAPGARDGARTTFQVFDETHRLILPAQKKSHQTMLANLPKRRLADAWSLETTTAYSPGENSVAEDTMDYARQVEQGKIKDSKLFFFHRQASEGHDLSTQAGIRAAVLEASGPVGEWSDVQGIVDQWQDPKADQTFLERVWLNRPVRQADRAFDMDRWNGQARPDETIPDGARVVLGFDGARFNDSSAVVATDIETGFQQLVGLWERPPNLETWEVPISELEQTVAQCFERWTVWRMYADPPYWETKLDEWAGRWGADVVVYWWTNRWKQIGYAIQAFDGAIRSGELTHDGSEELARHIGNAVRRNLRIVDDNGVPLWAIQKERPDSIHKMDGAMAAILSWEARGDAIKAGLMQEQEYQVFFVGGR
jgi:phage terminase large subunit-like protein